MAEGRLYFFDCCHLVDFDPLAFTADGEIAHPDQTLIDETKCNVAELCEDKFKGGCYHDEKGFACKYLDAEHHAFY